ncbi:adenylyl-sulfate kinase [Tahibacter amnicola]|uniref:Adenylyl-sulfate kinase n=1 Tax=Tahibacter amnicola TaxID=2976241 RepID=A0ABY6BDC6_9GAMM|nr:adenylyl-sulfate kinase [Tahibacter amnicola]UXI67830.1 adenylyl-sulfate kinase [Tahibacter amnicola]
MSVIWITGLAGAGKSTLAAALALRLRSEGHVVQLIDGDLVRQSLGPLGNGYSREDRLAVAGHIAALAHASSRAGQVAVVATVSLFQAIHAQNRARNADYFEVLVNGAPGRLARRAAELAGRGPRVGADIPPEFPLNPHLVLDNHGDGDDAVAMLADTLLDEWKRRHV